MKRRWKPLSKSSPKGRLIKRCDTLFRQVLKKDRGTCCEICGKDESVLAFPLSTFHIISKGASPRLRYMKENCLLACWTSGESRCCHNLFHAGGGHNDWNDNRRKWIVGRIMELKGFKFSDDFQLLKDKLHQIEQYMSAHNLLYLTALEMTLKEELHV